MYSNSLQHKFGKGLFALLLAFGVALSTAPTLFVLAEGEDTAPPPETTAPAESAETPSPAEEPPPAVIETGDAAASADTTNVVNTNVTDTSEDAAPLPDNTENVQPPESTETEGETTTGDTDTPPPSDETPIDDSATDNATTTTENTETPPAEAENTEGAEPQENDMTTDVAIDNTNDAAVESESGIEATTGENSASENPGDAIIDTGNVVATGNVINVVNTNIIDSEGLFLLLAPFLGLSGDFDLRQYSFFNDNSDSTCPLTCGSLDNLAVNNTNDADIVNSMVVRASTGGNSANGNGGDSYIDTGNAYASANIINVANTNIINSEYLVLTFNNIGNWTGDLVLPGTNFFERMFASLHADNGAGASLNGNGNGSGGSALEVNNTNEAAVGNNADVEANTGSNSASSTDGSSTVATGNASAGANVINQVNSNIISTGSFTILIRIHGNWLGKIFSKPEGISWEQTQSGLRIYSDSDSNPLAGSESNGNGNEDNKPHYTSLGNINNASITNNVSVLALTGENEINGAGNGIIQTGNAYASANIINIVNTTVIGKNWVLAIFNIFGNWTGNIAFGRPDLWLGASAQSTSDPMHVDSRATYSLTYRNTGDAPATNVILRDELDNHLAVIESSRTYSASGHVLQWNLGTVAPGAEETVTYTANIENATAIPFGTTSLTNNSSISSYETDANAGDNSDTISIDVYRPSQEIGPPGWAYVEWVNFEATKERHGSGPVTASSTVDYTITLKNTGPGSAYEVIVRDEMTDGEGNLINSLAWSLGEVKSQEEIKIDYTIRLTEKAKPGTYINRVIATGLDSRRYSVSSLYVYNQIEVIASPESTTGDSGSSNTVTESITEDVLPPVASEEVSVNNTLDPILSTLTLPVVAEVNANPLQPLEEKIKNHVEQRTDRRSPLLALLPWLGGWTAPLIAASLLALLLLIAALRRQEEQ